MPDEGLGRRLRADRVPAVTLLLCLENNVFRGGEGQLVDAVAKLRRKEHEGEDIPLGQRPGRPGFRGIDLALLGGPSA